MDKQIRNRIQRATQDARRLLEKELSEQLGGVFDILPDGAILPEPGSHLDDRQRVIRREIIAAIAHRASTGRTNAEAVADYIREAAFTFLNRFVALKMLEARGLLQECISKGDQSSGFKEFCGLAPGLLSLPDHGYRLYLECLFDELSTEVNVLFDRQDAVSLLWPRRQALLDLLEILNRPDLASAWGEDETIGWVYQYFNSDEERRKMREESAAPRNSRELAVRNQFFTPRYVVEFLTDNTLGRTWYEMRQGETKLKEQCRYLVRRPAEIFLAKDELVPTQDYDENLSQEELLKQPVYILFRAKKDPRDIKILDPACGSGHFLLYAFDLLLTIYEEGWADEQAPPSSVTRKTLREDYTDLNFLRATVPGLVLRHNLHGIDIDARCAQIAALSLWMRAQRAYNDFGLPRADRPLITKTSIVVAEPMPGERNFLREFTASLEPRALGQLVEIIFDKMKLAGEAGSLLKIEEEIRDTIAEAKQQWSRGPQPEQLALLPGLRQRKIEQLTIFDVRNITDEAFWEQAEKRICTALQDYAERVGNGDSFRRKLFSEDAARGFAFIDLCRKRYDVVLMNPPYGSCSTKAQGYLRQAYHDAHNDIFIGFVERVYIYLCDRGSFGTITSRNFMFNQRLAEFRKKFLLDNSLFHVFADLGNRVLDAAVDVSAFTVTAYRSYVTGSYGLFFDLFTSEDKGSELVKRIYALNQSHKSEGCFVRTNMFFEILPDQRISYNAPASVVRLFSLDSLEPKGGIVLKGLITGNDERYVRTWHELPHVNDTVAWKRFHKGGDYSPYYSDITLLLNWGENGEELKADAAQKYGSASRTIKNENHFGIESLGWGVNNSIGFAVKCIPKGCLFADIGPVFQPRDEDEIYISNARMKYHHYSEDS